MEEATELQLASNCFCPHLACAVDTDTSSHHCIELGVAGSGVCDCMTEALGESLGAHLQPEIASLFISDLCVSLHCWSFPQNKDS